MEHYYSARVEVAKAIGFELALSQFSILVLGGTPKAKNEAA